MEKITSIRKLRRFAKREGKDFSYKDLSGLDLSKIEPEFWEGAIFYYTNLSNTGIKFMPRNLGNDSIEGCNLEGVDLSDLTEDDWLFVNVKNVNLRETGAHINLSWQFNELGNLILDKGFADYEPEEWDDININLKMLELNPFIKVTPQKLSEIIREEIEDVSVFVTEDKAYGLVKKCEQILIKYDSGALGYLYATICDGWSDIDKLSFFNQLIIGKKFDVLDLSGIPAKVIINITFKKCIFGEIILDNPISELYGINLFTTSFENEFKKITLKQLNANSWRDLNTTRKIGKITFRRFIYLEIGKKCNSRCLFCRNHSFVECKERNMDRILHNLKKMKDYIDTIFIGGGEPALYWDDILKIYEYIRAEIVIVTNGSLPVLEGDDSKRMNIYISRHALSDEENRRILNTVSPNVKIFSVKEIKELAKLHTVTLTPVCIKGGLDTAEKICEYIEEFLQGKIKSIIISNLHSDASLGEKKMDYVDMCIDPKIFDKVQQKLLKQGFEEKELICSTGGYILKRYQKENYTVSFKIYLSKEELEKYWKNAFKRTFDFTMTPSGELYQDWNRGSLVVLEDED